MSIGITIATVMFCFYLFQYISEKREKEEEEDRYFQELLNSDTNVDKEMEGQDVGMNEPLRGWFKVLYAK